MITIHDKDIQNFALLYSDAATALDDVQDKIVQTACTSPPYFRQKSYLPEGDQLKGREIGQEKTVESYVKRLLEVTAQVWRVLRDDGVFWLNIGDKYRNGRLVGAPWRVALAMVDKQGWILNCDCIWRKPNAVPNGGKTRPSYNHEYVFMFSKSQRYFYDPECSLEALVEGSDVGYRLKLRKDKEAGGGYKTKEGGTGQNYITTNRTDGMKYRRSVWNINTDLGQHTSHVAVYPQELVETCILATSRPNDLVLDPFNGSGTTGVVALKHLRRYLGCELDERMIHESRARLSDIAPKGLNINDLFD
jgi:DNA modification methylase